MVHDSGYPSTLSEAEATAGHIAVHAQPRARGIVYSPCAREDCQCAMHLHIKRCCHQGLFRHGFRQQLLLLPVCKGHICTCRRHKGPKKNCGWATRTRCSSSCSPNRTMLKSLVPRTTKRRQSSRSQKSRSQQQVSRGAGTSPLGLKYSMPVRPRSRISWLRLP